MAAPDPSEIAAPDLRDDRDYRGRHHRDRRRVRLQGREQQPARDQDRSWPPPARRRSSRRPMPPPTMPARPVWAPSRRTKLASREEQPVDLSQAVQDNAARDAANQQTGDQGAAGVPVPLSTRPGGHPERHPGLFGARVLARISLRRVDPRVLAPVCRPQEGQGRFGAAGWIDRLERGRRPARRRRRRVPRGQSDPLVRGSEPSAGSSEGRRQASEEDDEDHLARDAEACRYRVDGQRKPTPRRSPPSRSRRRSRRRSQAPTPATKPPPTPPSRRAMGPSPCSSPHRRPRRKPRPRPPSSARSSPARCPVTGSGSARRKATGARSIGFARAG